MKITNLVEEIFAQAVALDQSGGLKNTIYAIGNEIYILNYDHTVLLRFRLRQSEGSFETPISFKANDYDSNVFEEKDGKIIFTSGNGEYQRKKVCGTTDLTAEEVRQLYKNYISEKENRSNSLLSSSVLSLLDSELSHIEFSGEEGESIKMIQRNIYSGGIIEVTKSEGDNLFKETLEYAFGPVAIKTDDFKALFTFQDVLKFSFPCKGKEDFIIVKGTDANKRDITGIIACCLYDEVILLQEANKVSQNLALNLKGGINMGGKSRKSGGVSKKLIETLKSGKFNSNSTKKSCNPKKDAAIKGKYLFDSDEGAEN